MSEIPYGHCHCGCGEKTSIIKSTHKKRGYFSGRPMRYICGHHVRNKTGENAHAWNGGVGKRADGYYMVTKPNHPKANHNGMVRRAVLIAGEALGKPLPEKAVMHHYDTDRANDKKTNLIICQDQAYHFLLHLRQRAYDACGDPHWKKCNICKQYDDPNNLYISPKGDTIRHRKCQLEYSKIKKGGEHD